MSNVPEEYRPCRKLLRAVADLHTRGYQRLRIIPYQYEGLGTWRCTVAPAHWVSSSHGARLDRGTPTEELAHYTSASLRNYWEWEDTSHCSPGELAAVFLERFPKLAGLGYGQDWAYAGWYQYMLHVTYPDALPIANSPYDNYPIQPGSAAEPEPEGYMTTEGARIIQFALPPVGLAPCKPRNQGSQG